MPKKAIKSGTQGRKNKVLKTYIDFKCQLWTKVRPPHQANIVAVKAGLQLFLLEVRGEKRRKLCSCPPFLIKWGIAPYPKF